MAAAAVAPGPAGIGRAPTWTPPVVGFDGTTVAMKQDDQPQNSGLLLVRPWPAVPDRDRAARETQDRILGAVVELIAERGLAGVSHRAVADQAGSEPVGDQLLLRLKAELERAAGGVTTGADSTLTTGGRGAVSASATSSGTTSWWTHCGRALFTASGLTMLLGSHLEVFLNSARRATSGDLCSLTLDAMHDLLLGGDRSR